MGVQQRAFYTYNDTALVRRHLGDLAEFVAIARRVGAVTAIVPIDPATSVDSAALQRYERFVAAGKAAGLPFVPIPHALDGHPIGAVTVSALDSHPNALGHHLAAVAHAAARSARDLALSRGRSVTLSGIGFNN